MKHTLIKYMVVLSLIVAIIMCAFVIMLILLFPLIISYVTGIWWHMLLYFVVPILIPAVLFLLHVIVAFIDYLVTYKNE